MKNEGFTSLAILIPIMFITVPALLANVGIPLDSLLETFLQQPISILAEQEAVLPAILETDSIPSATTPEENR